MDWLLSNNQSTSNPLSDKPLIMGIVNVTPDSFYDGGSYIHPDRAFQHAMNLIEQGVDIIDVGGESTKPDAIKIPLSLELDRIIPVIQRIRQNSSITLSIDTYKPEVMKAAVKAGANVINDIYALRQPGSLEAAAELKVPVCLMHMQGNPTTMQVKPNYPHGIISDITEFFRQRIHACQEVGILRSRLILDPGFGFGKSVKNNLSLVKHINNFTQFNIPLLLGVSRKSTIGALLDKKVEDRLIGSIGLAIYAYLNGVKIIRTHDVDETSQGLKIIRSIEQAP